MMKLMNKKLTKKGFTLAELLIVVAILAILVAVSIPIFTSRLKMQRRVQTWQMRELQRLLRLLHI